MRNAFAASIVGSGIWLVARRIEPGVTVFDGALCVLILYVWWRMVDAELLALRLLRNHEARLGATEHFASAGWRAALRDLGKGSR